MTALKLLGSAARAQAQEQMEALAPAPKTVDFTIPGKVQAKERARSGQGRTFTPPKTRAYAEAARVCAKAAMAGRAPITGAVAVDIFVVMPIPPSWSQGKRDDYEYHSRFHVSRPDADNLAKAVLDPLNGVVFGDDAQVCCLHVAKQYGAHPAAHVSISSLGEP